MPTDPNDRHTSDTSDYNASAHDTGSPLPGVGDTLSTQSGDPLRPRTAMDNPGSVSVTHEQGAEASAVEQEAHVESRVALLERILHALLSAVGIVYDGADAHAAQLAETPGVANAKD